MRVKSAHVGYNVFTVARHAFHAQDHRLRVNGLSLCAEGVVVRSVTFLSGSSISPGISGQPGAKCPCRWSRAFWALYQAMAGFCYRQPPPCLDSLGSHLQCDFLQPSQPLYHGQYTDVFSGGPRISHIKTRERSCVCTQENRPEDCHNPT